ncbi:MAG: putative toxin-antitoxin system toxin component, PIN family [Novosphingobium sp.]
MSQLRVVLDTNVLVSGLVYPASIPGRILGAWRARSLGIVLSRYIIDEMVRVLPRLSHNKRSEAEVRDLAESLWFLWDVIVPEEAHEPDLRDAKDQAVLATLTTSGADYLITGDKDLLALSGKYPVVSPAEFWARHG